MSNMADFGLDNKIHRLNRVFAPNEYIRFCEMANYMGVSKQALTIRLQQLELLEVNHLKNPYELVDIFPGEEEQNAQIQCTDKQSGPLRTGSRRTGKANEDLFQQYDDGASMPIL